MPRPILLLTLILAAGLLGFAASATAPFHSPAFAGQYFCPEGSTLQVSQYKASWNEPGETGISIQCLDEHGAAQGSRELETRGFWTLAGVYFLPALAVLLLAAWWIGSLRRRARAREAPGMGPG